MDDYPGTVYPPTLVPPADTAGDEMASALATMRTCFLPLAKIIPATPLWVTENGFPSNNTGNTSQPAALRGMVDAVHRYSGTYNVTDYRWFDLRDADSASSNFEDQYGLMNDDYSPKPAFAVYQQLVASLSQPH